MSHLEGTLVALVGRSCVHYGEAVALQTVEEDHHRQRGVLPTAGKVVVAGPDARRDADQRVVTEWDLRVRGHDHGAGHNWYAGRAELGAWRQPRENAE